MAEMLLINPRGRKRRTGAKKRRTTKRRRNPIGIVKRATPRRPARRRSNPIGRVRRAIGRRRRNPIGLRGIGGSLFSGIKDAIIGAGGAVAVDMAFARLAPMLPASLQRVPGRVGAGDAVKALATVLIGKLLGKMLPGGVAAKATQGALTVQMHGIVSNMLPAGMVAGLGWYSPYPTIQASQRVGPMRGRMAAFTGGATPLLSAYMGGASPLLSGMSARQREGFAKR